jgi:hypothetical protein
VGTITQHRKLVVTLRQRLVQRRICSLQLVDAVLQLGQLLALALAATHTTKPENRHWVACNQLTGPKQGNAHIETCRQSDGEEMSCDNKAVLERRDCGRA